MKHAMLNKLVSLLVVGTLMGCATHLSDQIVARSDGLDKTPAWVNSNRTYPCDYKKGKRYVASTGEAMFLCSVAMTNAAADNDTFYRPLFFGDCKTWKLRPKAKTSIL